MNKKLLIVGFVWPEPTSSAAGSRMLQLIEQFNNQGFEITFACAAKKSANTFDLKSIGVQSEYVRLNCTSFDEFVLSLNPEIVLFDRFMTEEQYGWRVAEQCPNALRILDTEDLHGLRQARTLALKQNETLSVKHLQNDITLREIASIYRCDLSLIISEVEMQILQNEFRVPPEILHYLPFLLNPVEKQEICDLPKFEQRSHFITVGNFLHAPNYDAVLYLKQSIWPIIKRALPQAEMHIYGAYKSEKVTQLNNTKDGFIIKGYTENIDNVMQNAGVCLAALRFGAGLKGKLIDAMKNGTPAIMTNIAAEGLFGSLKPCGFVIDNLDDFAKKAIALYSNSEVWYASQTNGFVAYNERFNKANFEADFSTKINQLLSHLEAHREQNFLGLLLRHKTLQSSKYMSKWISEKNKL